MKKRIFILLFLAFLAVSLIILVANSLNYRQSLAVEKQDIRPVANVQYEAANGKRESLILPASLQGLPPRTTVTLWAEARVLPGESIFVKSVFAPLRLYVNDELFYEYGQAGSYPAFLNDPPTGLAILKLPMEGGTVSLRAEYESLTQRSALSLPVFYIGEHAALLNRLLQTDGFSFLFSLMLIFLGLIMTVIAFALVRKIPSGMSFLWLGLFSLAAGAWVFGECDFASRILPYPSLLYILDYMGLFFIAIPFLHFGLVILAPKNKLPIRVMLLVHYFSVVAAVLLQLTGKVDFIKTLFWFHMITPLAFVLFAVCLVWEGLKHKNPASKQFAPAIVLLAFSTVLELINYWFRFTDALTIFFQFGVLFFIISLGIVSGYYVRESLHTAIEKQRLEQEMKNMEKQLSLQRLQYHKMAEDEERLKKERHDFRHHLAVLKSITMDKEKLSNYLDQLAAKALANYDMLLCENYAVNAVASYYHNMAQEKGINIAAALVVPRDLPAGIESDLCVIVGNLMENAVEACMRAADKKQAFIRINSSLNYDTLTITVDNSHSGMIKKKDNFFLSLKREGEGIGISSVMAVADKYNGGTRFEEDNGMFKASVYLNIATIMPGA